MYTHKARDIKAGIGLGAQRALMLSVLLAVAPLLFPVMALAQSVLEEVVVTAQKRAESAQDVPISINVVSGERIVSSGITDLGDMSPYVPNFSYNQTGISSTLKMRGISSGINPGFEQSVGMYVDGIYYGRGQLSRLPYYDLERVEVLRGPQSVLFGKNTIAGTLNVQTARPNTEEVDGHIRFSYDHESGREEYNLAIGGPLTRHLAARLSYQLRDVDGYYENTFTGEDESSDKEESLRLGLFFENRNVSLYVKAERNDFDSVGRFLEVVNPVGNQVNTAIPFTSYAAFLGMFFGPDGEAGSGYVLDTRQDYRRQSNGDFSNNEHGAYLAEFKYKHPSEGDLTVVIGRNEFETDENCDCDFTAANVFTADSREDYKQTSAEFRWASPGGQVVDYVVGAYAQRYTQDFADFIRLPQNGVLPGAIISGAIARLRAVPAAVPLADALMAAQAGLVGDYRGGATGRTFFQDSSLWSVFAQVTYNINDSMRLVFGGRYTDETKTGTRRQFHIDQNGVDQGAGSGPLNAIYALVGIESYDKLRNTRAEEVFTPLLTWQWDFLSGHMWYATYTRGYKAGGFDVRSNRHPGLDYRTNPRNAGVAPMTGYDPVFTDAEPGLARAAMGRLMELGSGSFEYEEERADTFESGIKSVLADGAAEFNVSLFVTEYEDLQISQFDGVLGFNVTNAGEASIHGLEVDSRWNITENFQFRGTMAYLDFEYDEFPDAECDFAGVQATPQAEMPVCDLKGRTAEYAPEITALLSLDYTFPADGRVDVGIGVDVEYSDEYFVSPTLDENLKQDSFARLDGRLMVVPKVGSWELLLTVKNMTNQEVNTFGNRLPLSDTVTGRNATAYYSFFQPPRSVLFQYTYKF